MQDSEMEKNAEIYSVAYNKDLRAVLSGGGDDALTLHMYKDGEYVTEEEIEELGDSVVYTAFLNSRTGIGVCMNGRVVMVDMERDGQGLSREYHAVDLEADTASAVAIEDHLYLGFADGSIGRLPLKGTRSAALDMVLVGHKGEVVSLAGRGGRLFAASRNKLLVFDTKTGERKGAHDFPEEEEVTVMSMSPDGLSVGVGTKSGGVHVFRLNPSAPNSLGRIKSSKLPYSVESIAFSENKLIYGGFGGAVEALEMGTGFTRSYSLAGQGTADEDKEQCCVVKLLPVSEFIAIAATNGGKLCVLDLRREDCVVKEYMCSGAIFDFALCGVFACVGTSDGVEFIDLRSG